MYAKKKKSGTPPTSFFQFFSWKSRLRKQKYLEFGHLHGVFLEIQNCILPEKSGNPTPSMGGGAATFFWNSPMQLCWGIKLNCTFRIWIQLGSIHDGTSAMANYDSEWLIFSKPWHPTAEGYILCTSSRN